MPQWPLPGTTWRLLVCECTAAAYAQHAQKQTAHYQMCLQSYLRGKCQAPQPPSHNNGLQNICEMLRSAFSAMQTLDVPAVPEKLIRLH